MRHKQGCLSPLTGATVWEGISKKEVVAEGNDIPFYSVSLGHLIEPLYATWMTRLEKDEGETEKSLSLALPLSFSLL